MLETSVTICNGLRVWNSLPEKVHLTKSVLALRSQRKTRPILNSYPPQTVSVSSRTSFLAIDRTHPGIWLALLAVLSSSLKYCYSGNRLAYRTSYNRPKLVEEWTAVGFLSLS